MTMTRKAQAPKAREAAIRKQIVEKRKVATKARPAATVSGHEGVWAAAVSGRVLKVCKIGNSLGVRLPKDVVTSMGLGLGDELHPMIDSEGLLLRTYDPDFSRKLKAYQRTSKKFKNALRELAK